MSITPSLLGAVQAVGRDLFLAGLISSHSGTLSVCVDGRIWISRRDGMLGRLTADDFVEFALDGECPETASEDVRIHQAIYRSTDARATIHARPPATMALALIDDRLAPANGEGVDVFGTVPVAISQRPVGSVEVAELIGHMLRENRIVALRGHGVFAWGSDLDDALHMVSLLEEMCRVTCIFRSLSKEEEQPFFPERVERQPGGAGGYRPRGDGLGGRPAPHPNTRRPNLPRRGEVGRRRLPHEPRTSLGPFRP